MRLFVDKGNAVPTHADQRAQQPTTANAEPTSENGEDEIGATASELMPPKKKARVYIPQEGDDDGADDHKNSPHVEGANGGEDDKSPAQEVVVADEDVDKTEDDDLKFSLDDDDDASRSDLTVKEPPRVNGRSEEQARAVGAVLETSTAAIAPALVCGPFGSLQRELAQIALNDSREASIRLLFDLLKNDNGRYIPSAIWNAFCGAVSSFDKAIAPPNRNIVLQAFATRYCVCVQLLNTAADFRRTLLVEPVRFHGLTVFLAHDAEKDLYANVSVLVGGGEDGSTEREH